jgi:hypothetical protein
MTWTSAHSESLLAHFSGAHLADYGLRSWLAGCLERAEGAAQSDLVRSVEWNGYGPPPDQVVLCKGSRAGASAETTEKTDRALRAVERERRIRLALDALDADHCAALALYYTPLPPNAPHGLKSLREMRSVVAYVVGHDEARRLVREAAAALPDAEPRERIAAKAARSLVRVELAGAKMRATNLLEAARNEYAEAIARVVRVERKSKERHRRAMDSIKPKGAQERG